MNYEPVIGLEVHAELATATKMFCACQVVDTTVTAPNTSVCPVCAGMPGALPVLNRLAVEYGIKVGLALGCEIRRTSIFARKNYFYPDLPKGYQISQYEFPLAVNGKMIINTSEGERVIRITRAHLEEDAGKLTHVTDTDKDYSLVDLNRAGVPLLEIVSEPDMHSIEDVRAYATGLRAILRELEVNSGNMEKGVIRFEANISIRPVGSVEFGTRVEIKNLNSFRTMERAIAYELERQADLLDKGEQVLQETRGWNENTQATYLQRSKEEAHDYRYFPEPDLPPLIVEKDWVEAVRATLPELPHPKAQRLQRQYALTSNEAALIAGEREVAEYFEACAEALKFAQPRTASVWITGELFAWLNQSGTTFSEIKVSPRMFAELLDILHQGSINQNTAKSVLTKMLQSGEPAPVIIEREGLIQLSDATFISKLVADVIASHSKERESYLAGKETLANWFFGQAMRAAGGKANPGLLKAELEKQLHHLKENQ